jgi:hypothetical protein
MVTSKGELKTRRADDLHCHGSNTAQNIYLLSIINLLVIRVSMLMGMILYIYGANSVLHNPQPSGRHKSFGIFTAIVPVSGPHKAHVILRSLGQFVAHLPRRENSCYTDLKPEFRKKERASIRDVMS